MVSIDGDLIAATLSYDPNGNQTGATGIGRTVAYNSSNRNGQGPRTPIISR